MRKLLKNIKFNTCNKHWSILLLLSRAKRGFLPWLLHKLCSFSFRTREIGREGPSPSPLLPFASPVAAITVAPSLQSMPPVSPPPTFLLLFPSLPSSSGKAYIPTLLSSAPSNSSPSSSLAATPSRSFPSSKFIPLFLSRRRWSIFYCQPRYTGSLWE